MPNQIGCRMVALMHGLLAMARTLTLKNLPDALHARLAAAAKRHRRSLNNEAILCLEAGLARTQGTLDQRLTTIRALRQSLPPLPADPTTIQTLKAAGRP